MLVTTAIATLSNFVSQIYVCLDLSVSLEIKLESKQSFAEVVYRKIFANYRKSPLLCHLLGKETKDFDLLSDTTAKTETGLCESLNPCRHFS